MGVDLPLLVRCRLVLIGGPLIARGVHIVLLNGGLVRIGRRLVVVERCLIHIRRRLIGIRRGLIGVAHLPLCHVRHPSSGVSSPGQPESRTHGVLVTLGQR
jgi:hypothetical protein